MNRDVNVRDLIKDNVQPGDILLSRRRRDPIRQATLDGVHGYWRYAFLCLEDDQVLVCCNGTCKRTPISSLLTDGEYDFGLFRVITDLTTDDFDRVREGILRLLAWEYNGFHFTYSQEELICIGYEDIGLDLVDYPCWKTTPIDFDKSPYTIRIV